MILEHLMKQFMKIMRNLKKKAKKIVTLEILMKHYQINKLKNLKNKAKRKMILINLMRILKKTKNQMKKQLLKMNKNKKMSHLRKMILEISKKNLMRNNLKFKMIKNLNVMKILVILERHQRNQKLKINLRMMTLAISVKLQKVKSKRILVNSTKPLFLPLPKKKILEILTSPWKLLKRKHLHPFK